jgi:hypothetical protein
LFKLFNRSKKKDSKAEAKEKTVATPHRADDNNFYVVSIPVIGAVVRMADDGTMEDIASGPTWLRIVFYKVKESPVPGISKEDKR